MFLPRIDSRFTVIDIDPAASNETVGGAISLRNGNFLLLTETFGRDGDVGMRQFTATGTGATSFQRVNTTTFSTQEDVEAVQLKNGNILVSWTDNSRTAPDFDGATVRFQLFNASGVAIGAERTAPSLTDGDQSLKTVVALQDGRFALTWQQNTNGNATVFRIFNADGTPAGVERVTAPGFGTDSGNNIAAFGASGLIAVGITNNLGNSAITVQRFSASGAPTGDSIIVNTGSFYRDPRIVRLADGTFAIIWTDTSDTPPYNNGDIVRGQVIAANGVKIGGVFTVSEDIFSEHRSAVITALSDGRFSVSWRTNPAGDSLFDKQLMRIFNADGTVASDILTVYDTNVAYEGIRGGITSLLSSVIELPDGRLVFTFSALNPGGSAFVAATRIVDPRSAQDLTLGSGNDSFVGTAFGDRIDGGFGDDTLDGMNGGDLLDGASGNDSLQGGGGNDRLTGGFGLDTLQGGTGNDRLSGDADADDLSGDAGNDLINGGTGNDRLYGGTGDDTLIGGAGKDTMSGGTGDDVFLFNTVADSGVGATNRDLIQTFVSGEDKIDLSRIDANSVAAGEQSFVFGGTTAAAFTVWLETSGSLRLIRGDVNGDGVADFEIQVTSGTDLLATDFVF